jgi:hypothetical protein
MLFVASTYEYVMTLWQWFVRYADIMLGIACGMQDVSGLGSIPVLSWLFVILLVDYTKISDGSRYRTRELFRKMFPCRYIF